MNIKYLIFFQFLSVDIIYAEVCPATELCANYLIERNANGQETVTCKNVTEFRLLNFHRLDKRGYSCEPASMLELKFITSRLILDWTFNWTSLFESVNKNVIGQNRILVVVFENLSGFELVQETTGQMTALDDSFRFLIQIQKSNFDFYLNETRLKLCRQQTYRSVFNAFKITDVILDFSSLQTEQEICPSLFKHTQIRNLNLFAMSNVSYLKFADEGFGKTSSLNCSIYSLTVTSGTNLTLNGEILNRYVFEHLQELIIDSELQSIDRFVFRPIKSLVFVYILTENVRNFMHRTGTQWIADLNDDVDVDAGNFRQLFANKNRIITLRLTLRANATDWINESFPDEDFCFYSNLTGRNLVLLDVYRINQMENAEMSAASNVIYNYLTLYSRNIQYALQTSTFNATNVSQLSIETRLSDLRRLKEQIFNFSRRVQDCARYLTTYSENQTTKSNIVPIDELLTLQPTDVPTFSSDIDTTRTTDSTTVKSTTSTKTTTTVTITTTTITNNSKSANKLAHFWVLYIFVFVWVNFFFSNQQT